MKVYKILLFVNIALILMLSFSQLSFFIEYRLYRYDIYFHSIMYFFLIILVLQTISSKKDIKHTILWILTLILLPILTEYVQQYLPYRRADLIDISYDYLGMLFGIILFTIFKYVKTNKYQEFSNH